MSSVEIQSLYVPRKYQWEARQALRRLKRLMLVFHRRAGKDLCCWNIMIEEAISAKGAYYYIFPTYKQARRALWEAIDNTGIAFLQYIPREFIKGKPNATEMKIELKNGSIIRLLGSDNFDDLRGANPKGVVLSEFAYQRPEIWSAILEPILLQNGGWAIFNSTPFGKNHFYAMYEYAKKTPQEWYSKLLTIKDTGLVSDAEIEKLKDQGTSIETIEQEYYCSFNRGVEGSYYARIINELRLKGQIGIVLHDRYAKVYTAWDLGIGDSTAIWWFQCIGQEFHFIDYYENSGESLEHYVRVLEERQATHKYRYETHFAPHDIMHRELGTGTSRRAIAEELGISFVVLPAQSPDLGIEIARKLLRHSWFDEKLCSRGIDALENYRKKWDEKNKIYSDHPLHDWSSHGSDSIRYAFTAIQDYISRGSNANLTPEKLKEIKQNALQRPATNILGSQF